jgi:predicted Zn-dependent protease
MTKNVHAALLALAAVTLAALAGCGPSNDPARLIAKSQEYRQKGNYQAAMIELKNVLQKNPDHAEARYLLGTDYLEAGDPRAAEAELRRASKLGVEPAKTLPPLAKSLLLQGKRRKRSTRPTLRAFQASKIRQTSSMCAASRSFPNDFPRKQGNRSIRRSRCGLKMSTHCSGTQGSRLQKRNWMKQRSSSTARSPPTRKTSKHGS